MVLKELSSLIHKPCQARAEKAQLPLVSISSAMQMKIFSTLTFMPGSNVPVAEATQADQNCITGSSLLSACVMVFSICSFFPLCTLRFTITGQADYIEAHAYSVK